MRRILIRCGFFTKHSLARHDKPEDVDAFVNRAAPFAWERVIELPLVGMKYCRPHKIAVEIENRSGERLAASQPLMFKTPEKPKDPTLVPPVRVMKRVAEKMKRGFTVASLRRNVRAAGARRRGGTTFGLLAAFDSAGEIVWSYYSDARISDVEPTRHGTFLFVTTDNRVTEIDVLGNKLGEWFAANRPDGPGKLLVIYRANTTACKENGQLVFDQSDSHLGSRGSIRRTTV